MATQGEINAFLVHVGHCADALGVTDAEALLALRQLCQKKATDCGEAYRAAVEDSAINGTAAPSDACTLERLAYMAFFD